MPKRPHDPEADRQLEPVVREFIAYWERDGGCGMCGGTRHSTTCFVGRMQATLMSAAASRVEPLIGPRDVERALDALIGEIDGAGEDEKKTRWMAQAWHRRVTWVRWLRTLRKQLT